MLSWKHKCFFRDSPIQHPPLYGLLILRTGSYLKADALSTELREHINLKQQDVSMMLAVCVNRASEDHQTSFVFLSAKTKQVKDWSGYGKVTAFLIEPLCHNEKIKHAGLP